MTTIDLKYKQVPGRGLMNQTAYELRMEYLKKLSPDIEEAINSNTISLEQIQNNIESYIGTIEIPMGLIGPLLYINEENQPEWTYTAVATTEGALTASMNRGAKAISECGGFRAHTVHQKMLRTPMFTFNTLGESLAFDKWINTKFDTIKAVTKKHSNYADLLEISSVVVGKIVHLKFIYSTCDASGQNMTTSCTWNACLWIEENFHEDTGIEILHFVIDGNGASDKKVSYYSMQNGRGTNVISECFLTNEIIEKTLRTNADDMFRSFNHSMAISRLDGMIGYNINVANAIAGIFGSTGQDLACIHESSTAVLQMEQTPEGLYLSLSLPNLVVGTVGGGTHLPVQSKILELMGCKGAGKVERFAKLIAGFALSIEISTLAAIVSGQFARAHQKLGRNKPIKWLLKSEIDKAFFSKYLQHLPHPLEMVDFENLPVLDNGIITDLTRKVSKKVIGFQQARFTLENEEELLVLMKSKALDEEVFDGLHFMASNINVELADTLLKHKEVLEYKNCHLKEIKMYEALKAMNCASIPTFFGSGIEPSREIYMLVTGLLEEKNMKLFNSENSPELWSDQHILGAIDAIHEVHVNFIDQQEEVPSVQTFDVTQGLELYQRFNEINRKDYDYLKTDHLFNELKQTMRLWQKKAPVFKGKKTIIHNDYNPRNVAVRSNGNICIYDWELAVLNVPQRDIFEFLGFTLTEDFSRERLEHLLHYHFEKVREINNKGYTWDDYLDDFMLAGNEFLIARVSFYLTGSTLVNYPFIERVFKTSFKMLHQLRELYD